MDMKKLLSIVSGSAEKKQLSESTVNECGMGMQPNMAPPTPPVSMSVNLNAQGIDQIKDLLNLMNKADSPLAPGAVPTEMPPMPMPTVGMDAPLNIAPKEPAAPADMDPLDDIVKKAGLALAPKPAEKEEGEEAPAAKEEPAPKDAVAKMADDIRTMTDTLANTPEEEIAGLDAAVPSGDDLHKEKGTYPKVAGGDNPMQKTEGQIKSDLMKLYMEIKEAKEKKAKKDWDGDGEVESEKDEVWGSRMKAAKKTEEDIEEGFDSDAKVGDTFKTAKGTATKTSTGVRHTRDKYDYDPGSDDKDDKKMKRDAKKKK